MPMQRYPERQVVTITDALGTTEEVPYGNFAGGRIHVPTGSSITSLTFYDSTEKGGDYLASQDSAATPAAIVLTVEDGKSYPIPADMFGAAAFKMVGDAAGTVTLSLKT